jgi:Zn-dependent protease with chaperone function
MRLILIIILGFIALSIVATLVGPLIVLGIGAVLAYYAYKNLVKSNKSALSIIGWVIVGAAGVSMFVGTLPKLVFIAAIAALVYVAFRKSNIKPQPNVEINPNGSSVFSEYESFEAEWRDITKR